MTINSRAKGAVGELELAAVLKEHGFEARRGQQFSGGSDSPDVIVNMPGIHWECKRVEEKAAGTIYDWLEQALRDAKDKQAVVAHRRNRKPWVAILLLDDYLLMYRELEQLRVLHAAAKSS